MSEAIYIPDYKVNGAVMVEDGTITGFQLSGNEFRLTGCGHFPRLMAGDRISDGPKRVIYVVKVDKVVSETSIMQVHSLIEHNVAVFEQPPTWKITGRFSLDAPRKDYGVMMRA